MTKINIDTSELNRDLLPNFNDAIDHLNKSLELFSQIVIPPNYKYINELTELNKQLENARNNLRDYYNSYKKASIHFDNINEDLLQQINHFKNINIFKK